MKIVSILFTLLLSTTAFAKDVCTLLVPFPPGGSTDIRARAMQLGNPDLTVDYKPGAFGSVAIDQMNKIDNAFLLSPAFMYSAKSPMKDPNVEMNRIIFAPPIKIITIKDLKVDDLADKPIKLGIPCKGCQMEGLALEIKSKNPNLSIITIHGDAKSLPMIMNGDLDIYLGIGTAIDRWANSFENIKIIGEISFQQTLKIRDIELINLNMTGIFTKGKIDNLEKTTIENCINKAVRSKEFHEQNKMNSLSYIDLSHAESQQILASYLAFMEKHGL